MKNESSNSDKGQDYHLRALGVYDRKDWDIVAADDRNYNDGCFIARPDFLIKHKTANAYAVFEYKNYPKGKGPSEKDRYQVIITTYAVMGDLARKGNKDAHVVGFIKYSDGETVSIKEEEDDFEYIMDITGCCSVLFCHHWKVIKTPSSLLPASWCSVICADPNNLEKPVYHNENNRLNGIKAHEEIHNGPLPYTIHDGEVDETLELPEPDIYH